MKQLSETADLDNDIEVRFVADHDNDMANVADLQPLSTCMYYTLCAGPAGRV